MPLQRLRPVIDELRRELGTPYPLATAKPFIADKDLVLTLQEKSDLPGPIAIVVRSGQQIILAADAQRFLKKVEFAPDGIEPARRLFPAGAASPVVIDPLVRFGRPAVHGVTTERLWELFDAGETIDQIIAGYDLPEPDVRAAIAYEEQLRSLAA